MWSNAYNTVNRDSSVIADKYARVLKNQKRYFEDETCSVKIPHSTNFKDCTGGYYVHHGMATTVICQKGYYVTGGVSDLFHVFSFNIK